MTENRHERAERLWKVAGRIARCALLDEHRDARALLSDLLDEDIWEVALILASIADPANLPPDEVDPVAVERLVRGEHPAIVHRVDLIAAIDRLALLGWTQIDIVRRLQGAGGLRVTRRIVGERMQLVREAA